MSFSRLLLSALVLLPLPAFADDALLLTLKDHQFTPTELVVPADKQVKITVRNEDGTPAEFESKSLGREKVINGNSSAIIIIGPLKAGSYAFVDEFHEDVAKGTIVAK